MKQSLVLILLVLIVGSIGANPLARIYQVDDPLLDTIEAISLENGVNPFSSAGPVSGYELARHLESIDKQNLTTRTRELYDSVKQYLNAPYTSKTWDSTIRITQEGYLNTDKDSKYYEWVESYNTREPLLYGQAETIFGDNAYGIFSYGLQKAFKASDFSGFKTNNPLVLHGGNTAIQNSVPHTAFLGFSGPWYTLVVGRDAIRIGRGSTGNLMIGSHVPYHDFLQLSLSNKKLKYTFLAIPMNELVTQEMITTQEIDPSNLGQAWYPHLNQNENIAWHTLFHGTRRRTYIAHRLEADILPWWRLAITEGTMIYADTLDLRMFNPMMFLHNLQNFGEVNNTLGIEAEITLSKRWALDVQFFIDQLQTSAEQGATELPPNANALLIGGRFRYPKEDWTFSGFIEGVYTSPFVYLRTGDSTQNYDPANADTQFNLDLVHAVSMENEGLSGVNWLGYVYGPDSIVLATKVAGTYKSLFEIFSDIRFVVQGERGLKIEGKEQEVELQPAGNINMLSPSGNNPTYSLILGLGASMNIPRTDISVYARNYWVNRWNNGGHKANYQLTIGASYEF